MTITVTDLLADIEPVVRGWIAQQIGDNAASNDPGDQFEFEFTDLADGQIIYYDAASTEWVNTSRSGGNNIYIGSGAGASMSATVNAVFIGINAGAGNTTADGNVFIGAYSGEANVNAGGCVFVGLHSGAANTATGGTYVGFYAGASNTLGSYSVFVGYLAGGGNTLGNDNVAIGAEANYLNQEGDENVILGTKAGRGAGVHNKSGCVHIGFEAGRADENSNRLYIENSNSATPLIYGEFDNDILIFHGQVIVDHTSTEALLVRKNADGGDVFRVNTTTSQIEIPTVNGIDFIPGSDTDVDLITVNVTGTPKIWWDESGNDIVTSINTRIQYPNAWLTIDDTAANTQWQIISSGHGLFFNRLDNNIFTATRLQMSPDANNVTGFNTANTTAQLNAVAATAGLGAIYLQSIANATVATALIKAGLAQTANTLEIQSSVGTVLSYFDNVGGLGIGIAAGIAGKTHIDQNSATGAVPVLYLDQGDVSEQIIKASYSGADVDMILWDLDVTGSPQKGWDESADAFNQNKGLILTAGDIDIEAGRISSATLDLSAAGPTDNLDVSGVNTVFIDTSGNNVTLGGTVGGVDGQILCIVVHDATNNFTLEHNEGTGNQDFILHAGGDEVMTAEYGGWIFVNDGGDHWHDASHAKHV